MCYVWNKEQENHGTVLESMVQSTRNLSVICRVFQTRLQSIVQLAKQFID